MRNSKNASPGWSRAICLHCGVHVTTSSCASKNCRTWEQASWICEKLASSPWKPPRMSDAASGGSPLRSGTLLRVVATVAALAMWFWTQSLIGSRAPSEGIGDVLHNLFAGLNFYFGQHASAANVLLIVSSGFIDLFGLFLVAEWIFLGRSRAFLGLVLLLGMRQVMQALCASPAIRRLQFSGLLKWRDCATCG